MQERLAASVLIQEQAGENRTGGVVEHETGKPGPHRNSGKTLNSLDQDGLDFFVCQHNRVGLHTAAA
jgi:hypothetical protein